MELEVADRLVVIERGEIVAEGTPEDVARQADSYTGQYLKRVLKRRQKPAVKRA